MIRAHRFVGLIAGCAAILTAAEPPKERQVVGQDQLAVTNKSELTFRAREDADVKNRELWYASKNGREWGNWQKHGIAFGRNNPIVWAAPEGHWQIYIRIEEISGLASPVPDANTAGQAQFIVDRTAPAVAITFPEEGSKLRGGERYDLTWTASDPHLHSTPITILWSRGGDDEWVTVAEHIPNTGTYGWTTPRDMTATGRLQIVAWDKAGNQGSTEVNGLVVDAIAPSRNVLGPRITATRDMNLSVSAQDAGPAGLASIKLWYSGDEGVTWNEGPTKSEAPWDTLAWTAPADGSYLLALVAVDQSGNRSAVPVAAGDAQGRLLVDTEQPVLTLASPIGVRQAGVDADAPLRRVYKPGDNVVVDFQVKDENLPGDAATVLFQVEDGAPWQPMGQGLDPSASYTFAIPDVATDSARIKVQVLDRAGNLGEATAGETFRIDNEVDTGEVTIEF